MPCTRAYLCHSYAEHPERSWVLCERRAGHLGRHRWRRWKWHDSESRTQHLLRLTTRIARRTAGERKDTHG